MFWTSIWTPRERWHCVRSRGLCLHPQQTTIQELWRQTLCSRQRRLSHQPWRRRRWQSHQSSPSHHKLLHRNGPKTVGNTMKGVYRFHTAKRQVLKAKVVFVVGSKTAMWAKHAASGLTAHSLTSIVPSMGVQTWETCTTQQLYPTCEGEGSQWPACMQSLLNGWSRQHNELSAPAALQTFCSMGKWHSASSKVCCQTDSWTTTSPAPTCKCDCNSLSLAATLWNASIVIVAGVNFLGHRPKHHKIQPDEILLWTLRPHPCLHNQWPSTFLPRGRCVSPPGLMQHPGACLWPVFGQAPSNCFALAVQCLILLIRCWALSRVEVERYLQTSSFKRYLLSSEPKASNIQVFIHAFCMKLLLKFRGLSSGKTSTYPALKQFVSANFFQL